MSIVDANYRFIAAAQEANARIAQRQQSLALYVTIVLSLLAAMVALGNGHSGGSSKAIWLLLGFPLASLCLVFLNYKSEAALTNLRSFLSELEQLGGAHERLPSFNTDVRWTLAANKARKFHDIASAFLAAGAHAIGIAVANSAAAGPETLILSAVTAATGVAVTIALLLVPRWRYQPLLRAP
ncbi:hypothetical protein [Hyphomicrobium sp.]|uniref:hypothetical protein n=1 Tax=Hyphomicrobium sp. TaxID=82 RepID=UPI003F70F11F